MVCIYFCGCRRLSLRARMYGGWVVQGWVQYFGVGHVRWQQLIRDTDARYEELYWCVYCKNVVDSNNSS